MNIISRIELTCNVFGLEYINARCDVMTDVVNGFTNSKKSILV